MQTAEDKMGRAMLIVSLILLSAVVIIAGVLGLIGFKLFELVVGWL